MKVGDLVKHKENGYIGLIVGREKAAWGTQALGSPFLYSIQWSDGYTAACWFDELAAINESR